MGTESNMKAGDRLRQFVERSRSTFLAHDMRGIITDVNAHACTTLGYSRAELIGMPLWEIERTLQPGNVQGIWSRLDPDTPIVFEGRHRTCQGNEFPVEVRLQVFEQHGVFSALAMCTDITERKRVETAQQQLRNELRTTRDAAAAASRAKSGFLANMSHELRTPLNAIIGYSELLVDGLGQQSATDTLQDLGRITQSASHLLALINDVLDLSRIEAGQLVLLMQPVGLRALLLNIASTVESLAGDTMLKTQLPQDLGEIQTDARRLRQVVLNLLSNALKFTPSGTVVLSARREGLEVVIEVRDSGIGIDPDDFERIFQPFGQVQHESGQGTGLGLPISRRICRKMGGDLVVSSEVGSGSTFRVMLPCSAIAGAPSPPPAPPRQARPEREILLIHPNTAVHERAILALVETHCSLRSAYDHATGSMLARAIRPTAVLVDLQTPGGAQLLDRLRVELDFERTRLLPVVIGDEVQVFGLGQPFFPLDELLFKLAEHG